MYLLVVIGDRAGNLDVLLEKVVTVDEIEHVRECVVRSLGHESEFAEQGVLRNGVRLSHDQVVSTGEQFKCIPEEID